MKAIYIAKVDNYKLKIINRKVFDHHIEQLNGKDITITIELKKKKRSNKQNAYYYAVVVPIIKQCLLDAGFNGYRNTEQVCDLLKYRFLKTNETNENGEFIERIKSTSELTTSQFMDLIAEIQQWASEYFNVQIPDPNENLKLEL
jgi:hypothetical protein